MKRGRLAPTPTGLLHVGHARTFALAAERAKGAGLVMRIEDLDGPRCHEEYVTAALDDLRWLGIEWTEGPDIGGPHAPYRQSERADWYLDVWRRLEAAGAIYPSPHSRRDVEEAGHAPHEVGQTSGLPISHPSPEADHTTSSESLQSDRPGGLSPLSGLSPRSSASPHSTDREAHRHFPPPPAADIVFPASLRPASWSRASSPGQVAWRFRVPDGRTITFTDARCGTVHRTAGVDFGDFVVWRRDNLAAYELAVVADDHAMEIEEVVRGEDLLTSTARQLLLYEALGWKPPAWCHAPLVCDAAGNRLAKRAGGLTIRDLRAAGKTPADILQGSA